MHLFTIPDMSAITFEMMKEVNKQKYRDEDYFYHLSEFQYYLTVLHEFFKLKNAFVSYYSSTIL
jgi:hypothetical protein